MNAPLRTEALEQILTERGLVDPGVMATFIATYETAVGPLNGAKVVARAWTDPEYKVRCSPTSPPRSGSSASRGPRASTSSSWRTPRRPTT